MGATCPLEAHRGQGDFEREANILCHEGVLVRLMEVINHIVRFISIATLAIAITACSSENPAPTPAKSQQAETEVEPTEKQEEATITVVPTPSYTSTPHPIETPLPTSTLVPTATPLPTSTPEPTATPKPTSTPEPTATPRPTATPIAQVLDLDELFARNMDFFEKGKVIENKVNRNAILFRAGRVSFEEVCAGWREYNAHITNYLDYLTDYFADNVDKIPPEALTATLGMQNGIQALYDNWRVEKADLLFECGIW